MDATLDRGADDAARLGGDVVGEILVEDVLGGHPAAEVLVAVTAAGGEVVRPEGVVDVRREADGRAGARSVRGLPDGAGHALTGARNGAWQRVELDRRLLDVEREAQAGDLAEAAVRDIRQRRHGGLEVVL